MSKPVERLIDALTDPTRRERTVLAVLAAYVAIWTLYGVIAKASQDMQFDAAELAIWAREPALGYAKHPPFAAWLVHVWFSLVPVRDWTYYLMSMIYAALGLWIAWRLFGPLLDSGKRVVGLAYLTLVPYFNFHGLRFDHNIVLGALWAATVLCFVRSFDSRRIGWAALAGIAAAAAMLGKYWSIFLLAGLAAAALVDCRRAVYFRSAAPWITVAAGALVLAPHGVWLIGHEFSPLSYAVEAHGATPFGRSLVSAAGFVIGGLGYAAVPTLMVMALTRPSRVVLRDILMPRAPERRFVAVTFWATLLLPAVIGVAFGFELNSVWAMPTLILAPLVMLSSPLLVVSRRAAVSIVTLALALPPVIAALSPAVAVAIHTAGVKPPTAHAKLLADRIDREWKQATDRPLRIVGGDFDLANVTAFYLPERPLAYPLMEPQTAPWISSARLAREGVALTCHLDEPPRVRLCNDHPVSAAIDRIAAGNPAARRVEVVIARSFLGIRGEPASYLIVIVPPR